MRGPVLLMATASSLTTAALVLAARPAAAQVNWDGQTGIVMTPSAQVATAPDGDPSLLTVSFRVLKGGEVLGTHFQSSLTTAVSRRVELGYTRSSIASASAGPLSTLFDRGFNTIHGKIVVLDDREPATHRAPRIAVGAAVRWQKEHLPGALGVATQNGDVYAVATQTFLRERPWGVMVNGGVRVTNASLHGLAGNAQDWSARAFAAAGLVRSGVALIAAEWVQQPASIDGDPAATLPATIAGVVRVTPLAGWLTVDVAVVRLGAVIAPGIDIKASRQLTVGLGVRY